MTTTSAIHAGKKAGVRRRGAGQADLKASILATMHRADFGSALRQLELSRTSMEVLATPLAAHVVHRKRMAVFFRRHPQGSAMVLHRCRIP